jgi:hypothetical protein
MKPSRPAHRVSDEQMLYATLLAWGTRVGFVALAIAFAAYVTGLLQAYVPLSQLPEFWHLPAKAYLAQTGVPEGWGWVAHIGHGEFASLAAITILAGISVACLVALLVAFRRRGDRAYAGITFAILAVIVVAASGVLNRLH